jgi:hypothetical protein
MSSLDRSIQISCLKGYDEINLGYEKSADFGNGVEVDGVEVRHIEHLLSVHAHCTAERWVRP